jgi:hypothetical protein
MIRPQTAAVHSAHRGGFFRHELFERGPAMTRHGHYALGGENPPKTTYYEQGKFGRLFPMLPPFATDTPTVRAALKELGEKGGVMDADETDIVANPNSRGI